MDPAIPPEWICFSPIPLYQVEVLVIWNRRERGTEEKGSDPSWHSTGLTEFKVTAAPGYSGDQQARRGVTILVWDP